MAKNANDKAAKDQAVEAPVDGDSKPKRRALTPEERIAKLEAELRAAKEKKEAKNKKAIDSLLEKRAALVTKREEIKTKIQRLDEDLVAAGYNLSNDEAPSDEAKVDAELRAV